MKRFLFLYLSMLFISGYADADERTIGPGIVINEPLDLTGVTKIINYGTINSNIYMTSALVIQNSGIINGDIDNDSAQLTQEIQSNNDITELTTVSNYDNYDVHVNNATDIISLTDLSQLGTGSFSFDNSTVVVNDFADWRDFKDRVNFSHFDHVTLIITDTYTAKTGDIIAPENLGLKSFSVRSQDADKLHRVDYVYSYGATALVITRETDYEKVFDDKRGTLLGGLRMQNPNDKLLTLMDSANNMNELNSIMNKSYRFNSSVLIHPINVINNFSMMNFINTENIGAGVDVGYIMSDSLNDLYGRAYIGGKYENVYLNLGLNINDFTVSNEVDDYKGTAYGLDIKSKIDISNFWIKNILGFNVVNFKTGDMFVENDIKNNPSGHSVYGTFDVGHDYNVFEYLVLSPFAGIGFQSASILNATDSNFDVRGGGNVKYGFVMDGLKYEYAIGGAINTNNDIFGMFKIGFLSVSDNAGISFGADVFKNEYGLNYKLSINGKIEF